VTFSPKDRQYSPAGVQLDGPHDSVRGCSDSLEPRPPSLSFFYRRAVNLNSDLCCVGCLPGCVASSYNLPFPSLLGYFFFSPYLHSSGTFEKEHKHLFLVSPCWSFFRRFGAASPFSVVTSFFRIFWMQLALFVRDTPEIGSFLVSLQSKHFRSWPPWVCCNGSVIFLNHFPIYFSFSPMRVPPAPALLYASVFRRFPLQKSIRALTLSSCFRSDWNWRPPTSLSIKRAFVEPPPLLREFLKQDVIFFEVCSFLLSSKNRGQCTNRIVDEILPIQMFAAAGRPCFRDPSSQRAASLPLLLQPGYFSPHSRESFHARSIR